MYTFRDSAGPILEQLTKTSPAVVIGICLMAAVYQIIEGIITTVLAKQYRSSFAYKNGITNAFLCSFYRVATLGSGSGVAAIIYLGEQGIEYGGGFGLYMIQYALHKIEHSVVFRDSFCDELGIYEKLVWRLRGTFSRRICGHICDHHRSVPVLLFKEIPPADLPAAGYRKSKIPRKI